MLVRVASVSVCRQINYDRSDPGNYRPGEVPDILFPKRQCDSTRMADLSLELPQGIGQNHLGAPPFPHLAPIARLADKLEFLFWIDAGEAQASTLHTRNCAGTHTSVIILAQTD